MCDKPCSGCPWLRSNQTPEAVAASPVDGRGNHWYSAETLRRHWRAAAEIGSMLPCHETDANAPLYGGKPAKAPKQPRICTGLSMLAAREVRAFMTAGQTFESYERLGRHRFTAIGLAGWAARLFWGGARFQLGSRAFVMPKISTEDDLRLGVPWSDPVHDQKPQRRRAKAS